MLGARNQPPGLWAHTQQHATTHTHMYTHPVFQVSHRHARTHSSLHVHWCPLRVCIPGITHSPVYTHTGPPHTHPPSRNTAGSSSAQHTYTRVHTHKALVVLLWPRKGRWGMGCREDKVQPLATCRPLSHADDPWLHPKGEDGWGGGGGAVLPGAGMSHLRTRTTKCTRTSQVSGCLDEGGGEGKGPAGQTPPQLPPQDLPVSGLTRQQSPPPALADNWRFTTGHSCWTQASL